MVNFHLAHFAMAPTPDVRISKHSCLNIDSTQMPRKREQRPLNQIIYDVARQNSLPDKAQVILLSFCKEELLPWLLACEPSSQEECKCFIQDKVFPPYNVTPKFNRCLALIHSRHCALWTIGADGTYEAPNLDHNRD